MPQSGAPAPQGEDHTYQYQVFTAIGRVMHGLLQCQGLLYIGSTGPCFFHHQKQTTIGPSSPPQDLHVNKKIITLLEFCLKNNYLLFKNRYFEQIHGAAMGSPINPLSVNLFMEEFEAKAISSAPIHPGYGLGMWMTPLASNRLDIVTSSSSISTLLTHTSSLL